MLIEISAIVWVFSLSTVGPQCLIWYYSSPEKLQYKVITIIIYLMVTRHIPHRQREHQLCCPDDLPLPLQTTVRYHTYSFNSCKRQCSGRTNTTRHTNQLWAVSRHFKQSLQKPVSSFKSSSHLQSVHITVIYTFCWNRQQLLSRVAGFFPRYCWFTVPYFVLFGTTPHKVTTRVTSQSASSIHQLEDVPLYATVPSVRDPKFSHFLKTAQIWKKNQINFW